jgi:hypothetical protein
LELHGDELNRNNGTTQGADFTISGILRCPRLRGHQREHQALFRGWELGLGLRQFRASPFQRIEALLALSPPLRRRKFRERNETGRHP